MAIVLKISKPGFDVKTCDDKDLIFSSELNTLKTAKVGTTSSNVAHGISYTPLFFAISKIDSTKWGIVGQNYHSGVPNIDSTYFYPECVGDEEVKYYIFYQTLL